MITMPNRREFLRSTAELPARSAASLGSCPTPPEHDLARGLKNGYFERMGYRIGNRLPTRRGR